MELNHSKRTFVIGDIHGAYKALIQCFKKANFDYQTDKLICLGDVCDGWPEVKESYAELKKINDLILLLGNHDEMALHWILEGYLDPAWLMQGGEATKASFGDSINQDYIDMISKSRSYYKLNNKLFVHAGCIPGKSLQEHTVYELIWDRSLVRLAIEKEEANYNDNITRFDEVYIGHTPTIRYGKSKPFKACEIWFMDTGAGWNGTLSMMDIDTKEVYQSDPVTGLYPDHPGRI